MDGLDETRVSQLHTTARPIGKVEYGPHEDENPTLEAGRVVWCHVKQTSGVYRLVRRRPVDR